MPLLLDRTKMKKFLLKVWWRSAATRTLFPMAFLAVGIPIVVASEGKGIVSNIGMAFIVIAIVTFVIGFSFEIHKSAADVDKAMTDKRERNG